MNDLNEILFSVNNAKTVEDLTHALLRVRFKQNTIAEAVSFGIKTSGKVARKNANSEANF